MSKKKQQNNNQAPMSEERFIKERMRNLEIGDCYYTENDLLNNGEGIVIVSRKHTGGRVSYCSYLVDTFCLGVKDVHWMTRAEDFELKEEVNHFNDIEPCDYVTAHNWIYGAVAFAEDAGIQPCREFQTAQYFLQEDDDDVPLIEFPFGKDGKHFLMAMNQAELNRYLPILRKNLGDDFHFSLKNDFNDSFDEDEYEEDKGDRENMFEIDKRFEERDSVYSYQHPEYPKKLNLCHQEVFDLLSQENDDYFMSDNVAKRLLSLPKEELRCDLEQTIYYILGRLYDDTAADSEYLAIGDAIMLLGEVGNTESSLEVLLETMRVPYNLYDLIIGDWSDEVLVPTIYKLGNSKLDRLKAFMLEEGLDHFPKSCISQTLCGIAWHDKKRRVEVIEWYRDLLNTVTDGNNHCNQIDPTLMGLIIADLTNIQAKELMPEINKAFQCDMVNYSICGKYQEVSKFMARGFNYDNGIELNLFSRLESMRRQMEQIDKIK